MAAVEIRIRRDTEANWLLANPVLASGEPTVAWKPDGTSYMRVGDGVRVWSELPDSKGAKGGKGDDGTVTPEMIALRDESVAAKNTTVAAREAAVTAKDDAVAAKLAAQAVGATNDAIMAGVASDPASAFATQLTGTISAAIGTVDVTSYGWGADKTPAQNVAAFIAAREYAISSGAKGLWIPDNPRNTSGKRLPYQIDRRLDPRGISLYGAGKHRSVIMPVANAGPPGNGYGITGRANDCAAIGSLDYDRYEINGITVDCNDVYLGGICLFGGMDTHIRNCAVYNCPKAAQQIAGKMDSNINPATSVGYSTKPAVNSSIEDGYVERSLWAFVMDGACHDCYMTNIYSKDAVRAHVSNDPHAGYAEEINSGVIRNATGVGAIPAPDNWIALPSQYMQAAGFNVRGSWLVDGFLLDGWPNVSNPAAGSPTPWGLYARVGRMQYQNGTVRGAPGAKIDRGIDIVDVALGSVVQNVVFENCKIGVRDRADTLGSAAHSVLDCVFINCDTPVNASTTIRPPAMPGTVYRGNRDAAGARVDPGYWQGTATLGTSLTTVTVAHSRGVVPAAKDVHVTPMGSLGAAKAWWVSSLTLNNISIAVDAAPGVAVPFQVVIDIS